MVTPREVVELDIPRSRTDRDGFAVAESEDATLEGVTSTVYLAALQYGHIHDEHQL